MREEEGGRRGGSRGRGEGKRSGVCKGGSFQEGVKQIATYGKMLAICISYKIIL